MPCVLDQGPTLTVQDHTNLTFTDTPSLSTALEAQRRHTSAGQPVRSVPEWWRKRVVRCCGVTVLHTALHNSSFSRPNTGESLSHPGVWVVYLRSTCVASHCHNMSESPRLSNTIDTVGTCHNDVSADKLVPQSDLDRSSVASWPGALSAETAPHPTTATARTQLRPF